jgi:hypothetical protein
MKQTDNKKKLRLSTETIKLLDPHRLREVAAGATTYRCPPSTAATHPTQIC